MRPLPTKRNPLVVAAAAPDYEELLARRRLGQTRLKVKPGQVGTSNATQAENLGPVDYVHLRAPLPDDLDESEIFANVDKRETYFFMRRSKDGYVSATGMFKIAFPWAAYAEEKAEREFLKSLYVTSKDEMAGNIWVSPEYALKLAELYGLTVWIRALLDPADIQNPPETALKQIAEPPKFELPVDNKIKLAPTTKTPRSRSVRSSSPTKNAATPSKTKSPKKRQTKAQKEAALAAANAASESLQSALDDAVSIAAEESTPASEVLAADSETVKVEVEQAVEVNGDTEVTHTNVSITMPAGSPELPLPQDTEAMLEKARQMVEEAKALEATAEGSSSSPKVLRKRKADDIEPSDIDKEMPTQPAKKAKILEEKLKREKVRNRAIVGVTAMLGIAAAIPYFF